MGELAIDVGKTIGLADGLTEHAWEQNFGEESHSGLDLLLQQISPDVIIYERFDHAQRNRVDYTPVEQIGVIKRYGQLLGDVVLIGQSRSVKQNFTNAKLKQLGLYIPGRPHAMDALRHLLHYKLKAGEFDLRRLKALS